MYKEVLGCVLYVIIGVLSNLEMFFFLCSTCTSSVVRLEDRGLYRETGQRD